RPGRARPGPVGRVRPRHPARPGRGLDPGDCATAPQPEGDAVIRVDPLARPEPLIRRVYAYAAYRLGDGPDAEDATSDTFERALRYRHRYDRSKGEPIAW